MTHETILAQCSNYEHGIKSHKAPVIYPYGPMDDCTVSYGDMLTKFDGASQKAMDDHTILDIAFISYNYRSSLVRSQRDAGAT